MTKVIISDDEDELTTMLQECHSEGGSELATASDSCAAMVATE